MLTGYDEGASFGDGPSGDGANKAAAGETGAGEAGAGEAGEGDAGAGEAETTARLDDVVSHEGAPRADEATDAPAADDSDET